MTLSLDQSMYIRQTISGLQREAVLGAVLAMIIILLFLRNLRGTLIIIVAIPLSILLAFIWFRFGNVTLNIMTFGGLALAVGRLVDDSIVELEAISRHYSHPRDGETKLQATLAAAKEVAAPIFISTLTTVIVFLPIVFLSGIAKLMFIPLTITVTVALFGSFFVSRSVTPLMCLKFLPPEKELDRASSKRSDRLRVIAHSMLEKLENWYDRRLRWSLERRRLVLWSVVGFAVVSCGLVFFIGTEFFPDQDEGQFSISVKMPVGTRAEVTDAYMRRIEDILRAEVPEVQAMISDVGVPSARGGNAFGRNSGSHAANIQVALVGLEHRQRSVFEIIKAVRPKLAQLPGASIFISPGGILRFLLNFGSTAPIDVEIRGFDLDAGTKLEGNIADRPLRARSNRRAIEPGRQSAGAAREDRP
jgi:multidrug efflux pump subunit AcrB